MFYKMVKVALLFLKIRNSQNAYSFATFWQLYKLISHDPLRFKLYKKNWKGIAVFFLQDCP